MRRRDPKTEEAIIDYINGYVEEYGTAPAMSEIAEKLQIHKSTVCRYFAEMREKGLLSATRHGKGMTRQMQNDREGLTRTANFGNAPIVGSIMCGSPSDNVEYYEGTVRLPVSLFGKGPLFILYASGDSMIEAGIDDGDMVVVRQQPTAEPGDIVVALTEDGTTLKRFYPEPEHQWIRLQPANRDMQPMFYREVTIQGVAVKVIKDIRNAGKRYRREE